ncbi:hypothetical protein GCM10010840_35290 [Deinococcus aerolatus]|uniref:Transposase n=1 Tax=Deinococcus aerolatus TaxID=522487 RepID=A0ABQ2GGF2_9DEIO|nr:helix-turn-helix domain-containing protein [Deinococcus aerolatus]GGL94223.1 hypothetical protein GCM10010840_35290 [Deinococcus aerolatus]
MSGWQLTRYSRAQLEERRLAALEWVARGTHKNQAVADHFGVSVHTVYSWRGRLKRNGSLQATVASGPTSRLTEEHNDSSCAPSCEKVLSIMAFEMRHGRPAV